MAFNQQENLRYFQFDNLQARHAIFTRHGGLSPEPWSSLNVGGTVGDDLTRVRANRNLSLKALGCEPESVFDVWQVHGTDVVCATAPRPDSEAVRQADVILTDKPELTLYMRFADCVPILLYDQNKGVVGIAHAGWMGTVRGTSIAAVRAMTNHYGSQPGDVLAAIGPSIGADHYEVGPDVIAQVQQAFGTDAKRLIEFRDGSTYFDLWGANRLQLEKSGVGQIEVAGICTACHLDDWFSHRAEKGKTGRFGALIALQS